MAIYANKIKRKKFFKKVKNSFVRLINATTNETEEVLPLYRVIWNNIKDGLDYGFDSFKYYIHHVDNESISLEGEYYDYFKRNANDRELEIVFEALTTELLPTYISKYTDLELTTGEDTNGKFFEIKYK